MSILRLGLPFCRDKHVTKRGKRPRRSWPSTNLTQESPAPKSVRGQLQAPARGKPKEQQGENTPPPSPSSAPDDPHTAGALPHNLAAPAFPLDTVLQLLTL